MSRTAVWKAVDMTHPQSIVTLAHAESSARLRVIHRYHHKKPDTCNRGTRTTLPYAFQPFSQRIPSMATSAAEDLGSMTNFCYGPFTHCFSFCSQTSIAMIVRYRLSLLLLVSSKKRLSRAEILWHAPTPYMIMGLPPKSRGLPFSPARTGKICQ